MFGPIEISTQGTLQVEMAVRECFVVASAGSSRAEELTLLPTTDPLEAVAAIGTDGANYDIETGHILAWLQDQAERRPLSVVGIRHDLVALRFVRPIRDTADLAYSLAAICPDVLDQGTGSISSLIEDLEETGRVVLWWD